MWGENGECYGDTGDWQQILENFDQRRKAKANDGAEDDVPGAGEPDMFGDAAAAE